MAYFRGDFPSGALGMQTGIHVFIPDWMQNSKCPVLYLLHGLSDNCSNWVRNTGVGRYSEEYGVAVVMPEVQRSFYTDMKYGSQYFTYVSEELFRFVHRMFGLSNRREQSFVAGLSMGGYGALKCALSYPRRYAGCAAFSSACDMAARISLDSGRYIPEMKAILGENLKLSPKDDLFRLAEKASRSEIRPRLYVTCGLDDGLLLENHRLRDHLDALGFELAYEEWEGNHTWEFWDESLRRTFRLFFS